MHREMIDTHKPPSMKIPDTIHFREVLRCNFQIMVQGKMRVATSRRSSVAAAAQYIANSLIVVPGSSGNQFFRIGEA